MVIFSQQSPTSAGPPQPVSETRFQGNLWFSQSELHLKGLTGPLDSARLDRPELCLPAAIGLPRRDRQGELGYLILVLVFFHGPRSTLHGFR